MKEPIRVLQVVTIMNMGGLENFLMNIYRNIDRSKVQFDFLVHREERGVFDDEIEKLGGNIYRLPAIRPTRFFSYLKELKAFFKAHDYQVVHSHLNENSALVLKVAKKLNVPVRIAHSHAKATAGSYKFLREFIKTRIDPNSTLNLACSEDAGKWLYGGKDFDVFKNSVDVEKFKYSNDPQQLEALKKSLGINHEDFVIGLVARFSPTKNHDFLIDVFHEYLKINPNSKLVLIGEGELKTAVRNKIKTLGIEEKVIFTGNVANPHTYLSVFNLFLLTSFYEGLGIVLVEAQCNGLPILMSDTMPKEIELTDLTNKLSLASPPIEWAKEIELIKRRSQDKERKGYDEIIRAKGYDVISNSEKMISIYKSELKK